MAIRPVYKRFDYRTGRWLFLLNPPDFEKVRDGYGCPNCLEDFQGILLLECPACQHMRDAQNDFMETPADMLPEPDPIYND